ncbi:hypothetical protein [Streptomyces cyanogenus]|uniref:DUF1707 domain-containing protein n=1 Tax=Streptomyces cyanogenus TaxID=80860 RepID=A0ABX7TTU8_STRCY|nr:hypothetical protein [Streptomyces cyanogenus]QTD99831.1 hypothetical protein S1361_21015 [Streptomyces cyanogenus]
MGERLSGNGVRGRRRVHPGDDAGSGPWDAPDLAALERVLASVIRDGHLDPEAERRALATFRDAHAAGVPAARTRRRDDWRPAAQRRARRSVKLTFGAVFASLALGGVAVAAIGSAGSSTDDDGAGRPSARPSAVVPDRPGGGDSSAPSAGSGATDRPAPAHDTEAHCRAYEQVEDRGKALDAAAWRRLVAAAGGKDKVPAYCSEQLARATAEPSRSAGADRSGKGGAAGGNGTAGNAGASGNDRSGNGSGGTDNAGNGQVSGGGNGGSDGSGGNGGKHK